MLRSFGTPTPDGDSPPLYCYKNPSDQLQLARINHSLRSRPLERVIFPGESLLFEAQPGSVLEVYVNSPSGAMLQNVIACDRLRVAESAHRHRICDDTSD